MNGCYILQVSKAHAMLDEARLLAERRVPPAVAQRCEEIHAAGGLGPPPPGALPDVLPPAVEAAPAHGPLDARLSGARDRYAPGLPFLSSCLPLHTGSLSEACQGSTQIPGGVGEYMLAATVKISSQLAENVSTRKHPLVPALCLLMVCRDAANMTMDRWQRPSRSSRLRGDDLDRRIVNIDPERILREQRAQRRLQSQSQVLLQACALAEGSSGCPDNKRATQCSHHVLQFSTRPGAAHLCTHW